MRPARPGPGPGPMGTYDPPGPGVSMLRDFFHCVSQRRFAAGTAATWTIASERIATPTNR